MVEIIEVSKFVTAVVIILTASWSVMSLIKKIVKWFRTNVLDKIFELERTTDVIKEDLQSSSEENLILMKGLKATLEAVAQKKCNGNIEDAINEIDDYTLSRSHVLRSKKKGD